MERCRLLEYSEITLHQKKDYEQVYNNSVRRSMKRSNSTDSGGPIGTELINNFRHQSLLEARNVLAQKLNNERQLPESFWQKTILSILPAIYPQYIAILRESIVPERISNRGKNTNRRIDHLLIDASGNVDLLEVKCPFEKNSVLMKTTYRNIFYTSKRAYKWDLTNRKIHLLLKSLRVVRRNTILRHMQKETSE